MTAAPVDHAVEAAVDYDGLSSADMWDMAIAHAHSPWPGREVR